MIEKLKRRLPGRGRVKNSQMRSSQNRAELSLSNEVHVRSARKKRAVGEIVSRAGAVFGRDRWEESVLSRQEDKITALGRCLKDIAEHQIARRTARFTDSVKRG